VVQGSVYILANAAYPGLLKIGKTTRSVLERTKELGTGSPENYTIVHSVLVADVDLIEKEIHRYLDSYRHRNDREFFTISIKAAINALNLIVAEFEDVDVPISSEDTERFELSIFHLEFRVAQYRHYDRFCCLLNQGNLAVETLGRRVKTFHKEFDITTPSKPYWSEKLLQLELSTTEYTRFIQKTVTDLERYAGSIKPSDHDHRLVIHPVADGLTLFYEETPLLKTEKGIFIREHRPDVIESYRARLRELVVGLAVDARNAVERLRNRTNIELRMQNAHKFGKKYAGKV